MTEEIESVQGEVIAFDYELIELEHRAVIEARTQAIKKNIRRTAQALVEIGEMLADVKARLPHGQFTLWLQVEFNWDVRSAQRFMSVSAMFKNDTGVVFPEDLLDKISIEQSALYILAAKSTPADIRREVLERSYKGEPFTKSKVKQIVQKRKLERFDTKSTTDESRIEDFYVGDWVEIQDSGAWYKKRGEVVEVDTFEIAVRLDQKKTRILRFYREQLRKVLPFEQSESTPSQGFYKKGDLALIGCPVDCDYKQYKGYWAIVERTTTSGNTEVQVAGKRVIVMQSDLDPIDSPTSDFRDVASKVNELLARNDLDPFDRRFLEMYLKEQFFTSRQINRLNQFWSDYFSS